MIFFRICFIILLLLCNLYANSNSINYKFQEMFENKNFQLKFWTTNLNRDKDINVSYSLDKKSFTQGKSSIKIDIDSVGFKDPTKEWYYYLEIPLNPTPNLEDKLSFSIDVKMDENSANNIQIGFNLRYMPITTGIYAFDKLNANEYNRWTTIKNSDLNSLFIQKHANLFLSNIYKAKLNSFGRTLSNVAILIKGRGRKKYQIHLDNLKIYGKVMPYKVFENKYHKEYSKYINGVKKNIEQKKILYSNILKDKTLANINEYKNRIDELFTKIDSCLKNRRPLKDRLVDELDFYLRRLQVANSSTEISLYKFPAMKHYRLTGYNTPLLEKVKSFNLKMTPNEYKSIAILLEAGNSYGKHTIEFSDFKGINGTFSKNALDMYIAKIWYQSGKDSTIKVGKFLTQELLLKDENLVKVDYKTKTNYLRVYDNNHQLKYIKISNPLDTFPKSNTITFNDSKEFKPFFLDKLRHKLLWGIIHIPKDTKEGNYTSIFKIKNSNNIVIKEFPINIQVLPFRLDKSDIQYSLYYTGKLTSKKVPPLDVYRKTYKQQEIELRDIKNHGILYPISYEKGDRLRDTLTLRDKIGFPKDRFYTVGFNIMDSNLIKKISKYQSLLKKFGYKRDSLYIYGIDEASISQLKREVNRIKLAHKHNTKVFVAGYGYTYRYLGKYLDLFNYSNGILQKDINKQIRGWHNQGKEIFAYASPQGGIENPEIYRRNFGCKLWKGGFDGAMNWAYQAQRGALWNDFDQFSKSPSPYRDELFTYPTTDGIVSTIEWEGFREAITDVRYISTLENLRDKLKSKGVNVHSLDNWLKNIDCNMDLYRLREEIIDKILEYRKKL